jgi:hypothetical protein
MYTWPRVRFEGYTPPDQQSRCKRKEQNNELSVTSKETRGHLALFIMNKRFRLLRMAGGQEIYTGRMELQTPDAYVACLNSHL